MSTPDAGHAVRTGPPAGSSCDGFAAGTGLHPDLVRRFVALGLLRRRPRRRRRAVVRRRPSWPPSPGSSGCVPACPSTTPRSAWCSTCWTASTSCEATLPARQEDARHGHEPADPEVAGGPAGRADRRCGFGHTEVDGEHLLLALLDQPDGLVPRLLEPAGADATGCERDLERELSRRPKVTGPGAAPGQVFVTQRLARLLDAAEREAKRLKDEYVSVEHLLLALAEEGSAHAAGRVAARSTGSTRDAFLRR